MKKISRRIESKCCIDNKTVQEVGQATDLLKIISEKNRLKILCVLKKGERCACDIGEDLNVPQNLSSHHLKILKEAKLITSRKEGLKVIYSINKKEMATFNTLLNNFLSQLDS